MRLLSKVIIFLSFIAGHIASEAQAQSTTTVCFSNNTRPLKLDSTEIRILYYKDRLVADSIKFSKSDCLKLYINRDYDSLLFIVDSFYHSNFLKRDYLEKHEDLNIEIYRSTMLNEVIIRPDIAGGTDRPFIREYLIRPLQSNKPQILRSFLEELPELDVGSSSSTAYGGKPITYLINFNKIDKEAVSNLPLKMILKVEIISNPILYNISDDGIVINIITKKG